MKITKKLIIVIPSVLLLTGCLGSKTEMVCEEGYTLVDEDMCEKVVTEVPQIMMSCEEGYEFNIKTHMCETESKYAAYYRLKCATGYDLNNSFMCEGEAESNAQLVSYCTTGTLVENGNTKTCEKQEKDNSLRVCDASCSIGKLEKIYTNGELVSRCIATTNTTQGKCPTGYSLNSDGTCGYNAAPTCSYSCTSGAKLINNDCYKVTSSAANTKYECTDGSAPSAGKCHAEKTISPITEYYCDDDDELDEYEKGTCIKIVQHDQVETAFCSDGYRLEDDVCKKTETKVATASK